MMATVPFETRLDVQTLASLDKWYRENGHAPRTRSDLIFMVVEDFAAMLVSGGKMERFDSLNEAAEYFARVFGSVGKPGRSERTLMAMRRAETLAADGFNSEYLRPTTKRQLTEEELQKAVADAAALLKTPTSVDTLT